MKKKKRLKKGVRRTILTIGITAETIGVIAMSSGMVGHRYVKAEEDPRAVINALTDLKKDDPVDCAPLKTYILNQYEGVTYDRR